MSFKTALPPPRQVMARLAKRVSAPLAAAPPPPTATTTAPPPYLRRAGWVPRAQEDFGDGGAYPECHVAQLRTVFPFFLLLTRRLRR